MDSSKKGKGNSKGSKTRRWSDADKSSKDSIAAVALATSDGVDVLAVGGRGEASLACGARVSLFRDESRLLAAVETHLRNADPDVLFTFDDRRLGLLAQRFRARHRRALQLGRFDATPLACASVTTYSKAWIKDRSERRMASANNLETHRCSGLGGRLGVDLLRSASVQKMNLNLPGSRRWRLHETTSPRGRRRGPQRV